MTVSPVPNEPTRFRVISDKALIQREPLSIGADFNDALAGLCCVLDAGAFKWIDCEGLERRHGIGKSPTQPPHLNPKSQHTVSFTRSPNENQDH